MLFLNFGLDLNPHAMVLRADIDGTSDDDTLTGTSDSDTIEGFAGEDEILGGDGDDTVLGGDGQDEIRGGDGDDVLDGGESVLGGADDDDLIFGEGGNDSIDGNAGNDAVYGGAGDDALSGSAGNDILEGGSGADGLTGGSGDDTLTGGAGADSFLGGSGADILTGGADADVLEGGAGNDTFIVRGASDGYGDAVYGGEGTDVLDLKGLKADEDYRVAYTDDTETGGTVTFLGEDGTTETGTLTFTDIDDIICFARGTLIETSRGAVAVEDLAEGDQVLTMDNGLQPIRWIGSKSVPATGKLAPIEFAPNALGNDRALRVSPMHRMLVTGWQAELLFGEHEVLIPAKMLVNDHSVRPVEGGDVEYFHIMFDAHEIVYAEGIPTESFHPGRQGFGALAEEARAEILTLFPELEYESRESYNFDSYGPTARHILKEYEARMLLNEQDSPITLDTLGA